MYGLLEEGMQRGTDDPKATVGVIVAVLGVGVVAPVRRLSMPALGVRRPDNDTPDLGVLAL